MAEGDGTKNYLAPEPMAGGQRPSSVAEDHRNATSNALLASVAGGTDASFPPESETETRLDSTGSLDSMAWHATQRGWHGHSSPSPAPILPVKVKPACDKWYVEQSSRVSPLPGVKIRQRAGDEPGSEVSPSADAGAEVGITGADGIALVATAATKLKTLRQLYVLVHDGEWACFLLTARGNLVLPSAPWDKAEAFGVPQKCKQVIHELLGPLENLSDAFAADLPRALESAAALMPLPSGHMLCGLRLATLSLHTHAVTLAAAFRKRRVTPTQQTNFPYYDVVRLQSDDLYRVLPTIRGDLVHVLPQLREQPIPPPVSILSNAEMQAAIQPVELEDATMQGVSSLPTVSLLSPPLTVSAWMCSLVDVGRLPAALRQTMRLTRRGAVLPVGAPLGCQGEMPGAQRHSSEYLAALCRACHVLPACGRRGSFSMLASTDQLGPALDGSDGSRMAPPTTFPSSLEELGASEPPAQGSAAGVPPRELMPAADQLAALQAADAELAPLVELAMEEDVGARTLPPPLARDNHVRASDFSMQDGLLFIRRDAPSILARCTGVTSSAFVPVIPCSLRKHFLQVYHDRAGHAGVRRTLSLLRAKVWWPGMRSDVRAWVAGCRACALAKKARTLAGEETLPEIGVYPWERIAFDVYHMGAASVDGYTHIIIFIDTLTHLVIMEAVQGPPDAPELLDVFMRFLVRYHGVPVSIRSDRDPALASSLSAEYAKVHGVALALGAAHQHHAAALVERFNGTLRDYLLTHRVSSGDARFYKYLPDIELAHNNLSTSPLGHSPFFAANLRDARLPSDMLHAPAPPVCRHTYVAERVLWIRAAWAAVRETLLLGAVRSKALADQKRAVDISFAVGDRVLVQKPCSKATGTSGPKLDVPHLGPFRVAEVLPGQRYKLEDLQTRRLFDEFPIDRLAIYPAITNDGDEGPAPGQRFVERILSRRTGGDGRYEYKVQLRGEPQRSASWYTVDELVLALDVVRAYNTTLDAAAADGAEPPREPLRAPPEADATLQLTHRPTFRVHHNSTPTPTFATKTGPSATKTGPVAVGGQPSTTIVTPPDVAMDAVDDASTVDPAQTYQRGRVRAIKYVRKVGSGWRLGVSWEGQDPHTGLAWDDSEIRASDFIGRDEQLLCDIQRLKENYVNERAAHLAPVDESPPPPAPSGAHPFLQLPPPPGHAGTLPSGTPEEASLLPQSVGGCSAPSFVAELGPSAWRSWPRYNHTTNLTATEPQYLLRRWERARLGKPPQLGPWRWVFLPQTREWDGERNRCKHFSATHDAELNAVAPPS